MKLYFLEWCLIKLRNNCFHIQVRSPVKSMSMEASFDTKPYRLSFKNLYDDSKPINTELTVDPEDASLDFNMNYDIGKLCFMSILVSPLFNSNRIIFPIHKLFRTISDCHYMVFDIHTGQFKM